VVLRLQYQLSLEYGVVFILVENIHDAPVLKCTESGELALAFEFDLKYKELNMYVERS